ncbi:hypothetical protein [Comamonas sp. F1-6]|uniref:hypothetical protein n=1 Tax=Comamonas sp. F1-6 TaxID=673550 RepID=UPI0031DF83C0
MKTIHNTNKALLRVLGLEDMKYIQAVDVALRPRQLPEVTVRMTVDLPAGSDTQVFRLIAPLTAVPRPCLDLDAMCRLACERLRHRIEDDAHEAINHCAYDSYDRAKQYTGFVRELIEESNPYPF